MNDFIVFESWYLCTDCLVDAMVLEIEGNKATISCPCCDKEARITRQEAVIWKQKCRREKEK